jgi:hypothetical protein
MEFAITKKTKRNCKIITGCVIREYKVMFKRKITMAKKERQ